MTKVCILTAGTGSRLNKYGKVINKAILPIKEKAIISHILMLFSPKNEFVIATGYRSYDVKNYLKIAHPKLKIKFVNVKNFNGPGSGPGRSLLYCKKLLQEEFFFVPSDLYTNINLKNKKKFENNIFWSSKVKQEETKNYLNFFHKNLRILDYIDKKNISDDSIYSWSGLCYIKDYKSFWNSLEKKKNKINNEYQISNGLIDLIKNKKSFIKKIQWKDLGNFINYEKEKKQYNKFDFSKDKEFIYFINNKVIKYSVNDLESKNKHLKFKLNKQVYPKNTKLMNNFLYYDFVKGENFYNVANKENFINLLKYCEKKLWIHKKVDRSSFYSNCNNFYRKKTLNRVNLFLKSMKHFDQIKIVNNIQVPSINKLLKRIDWKILSNGIPSYIHGDLQFDNIIKINSSFKLIDWRPDFDGVIKYGDLNYDFAKLLGGIYINYREVKKNKFIVERKKTNKYYVKFPKSKNIKSLLPILKNHISKKLNFNKIELIRALIYLNMSPLHKSPFSEGLFLLSKYLLTKNLILKK